MSSPHTVGTNMAINEAPLLVIQQFLGHSDPKTTLRYIRRAEELATRPYQYNINTDLTGFGAEEPGFSRYEPALGPAAGNGPTKASKLGQGFPDIIGRRGAACTYP